MSKTKVVVNACHGGFSLSEAAFNLLNKRRLNAGRDQLLYDCYITDRSDPMLVAVVEELGERASGPCSKLVINEIPSAFGNFFKIREYDGMEWVFCDLDALLKSKLKNLNLQELTDAETRAVLAEIQELVALDLRNR